MHRLTYLRAATVAAAGFLTLAVATPAHAQTDISINDDHVPTAAVGFETHECDGPFEALAPTIDGWHFQLAADGEDWHSLTLTFDSSGSEVAAMIDSRDPDNPSSGDGWTGYIDEAGQSDQAYVFTDAGWTLTAGTASVDDPGKQESFQLSHACPGLPDNDYGDGNGEDGQHGEKPADAAEPFTGDTLPQTGPSTLESAAGSLALAGSGLLIAGTLLFVLRRPRADRTR